MRDQLGQRVYPVHRLDKPTSGLLLFALNPTTARLLAEQDPADPTLRKQAPRVQTAVTDYQRLAIVELDVAVDRYPRARYSLVLLKPLTGRRH